MDNSHRDTFGAHHARGFRSRYRLQRTVGLRPIRNLAAALAILALMGSPAFANLITNGSFEAPVVPVGGFTNFNSGSTGIMGWTVVGPQASIVSGSYKSFGLSFPAQDGSQWLDLTGDGSNKVEGVKQTVATTAGATYDLSFFVGNQVNPGGIYGTSSTVDVLINGGPAQAFTNSLGTGGKTQVWEQFSLSFVAASSSSTVEFLNEDPATDNTNGLDNVVLAEHPTTTVPEPPTFALLALPLFVLGIVRLRQATAHPS